MATYPDASASCPIPVCTLTSDSDESAETLDCADSVRSFALSGFSPCQSANWFRTQRENSSRTLQDGFQSRIVPSHALLAAIETASTHILNAHLSFAEALVVGLSAEDIAFPFHSFW